MRVLNRRMKLSFGFKIIFVSFLLSCIVQCVGATTPIASFSTSLNYRTIQFTDSSIGTPNCWKWNFGDGSTSTEQNPTHTYSSDGQYTVTLDVGTDGQYLSSISKTVEAWELTQSSYSVDVTSGIAPLTVQFTDTSSGNPDKWKWVIANNPDGDFYAEDYVQNPSFVLTQPGRYWLYLEAKKTGSIYSGSKNWMSVITVASPYSGTSTTTTTASITATTTDTTIATTATTTDTTIATTATTTDTMAPTTVKTTKTPKKVDAIIQTTIPTTESTPVPEITSIQTATTKKTTAKKIFTSIPTDTPTQESPTGIGVMLLAVGLSGLLLVKRQ